MDLIQDQFYKDAMHIIAQRIKKGKSTLVAGVTGSGKTTLLNTVDYRGLRKTRLVWRSLYPITLSISEMMQQLTPYECKASPMKMGQYIREICGQNVVVTLDEAQHMRDSLWPYVKMMIDEGVPFVIAGVPELYKELKGKHPDILSRLRLIVTVNMASEDVFQKYKDLINKDVIDYVYGLCDFNARYLFDYIENIVDFYEQDKEYTGRIDFDYAEYALDQVAVGFNEIGPNALKEVDYSELFGLPKEGGKK